MLCLVIFFIFCIITAVLFLVKIKAAFEYTRNDIDDNIAISFYTLNGILKYKYEISLTDFGQKGFKFRLVTELRKKEKKVTGNKERLKISEIYDKYIQVRENYKVNKDLILNLKNYLKKRLVLDEFNLYISEGTGNACHTGIFCGLLWSITGIITSFLSNTFKTYKKCVSIKPEFNSKVFNMEFCCIFHVKLVHIIMLVTKIIFSKIKSKGKFRKEIGGDLSG